MPLYEFVCEICGCQFEELCSVNTSEIACPACGSAQTCRKVCMPSPLKKGAFPFPPTGKVHPLGRGLPRMGGCGGGCGKQG